MAHPLPPPGWYPDPSGAAGQQFFDGTRWSAQRAPAPVVINNTVAAPPPMLVSTGPNHLLHLVLTLLTGGLWLPVWLVVTIAKSRPAVAVAPAGGRPAGRGGLIFAAVVGGVIVLGMAIEHPEAFVGLAMLAGIGYLGYRAYERALERRTEATRVAARADAQHRAVLAGDDAAIYGQYPPDPLA